MGKLYRTGAGKLIDMDKLRLANEDTIAVGNQKVNARGDKIGRGGQVVQPRNAVMDQHYKIHTPVATETVYQKQQQARAAGADVVQGTVKNDQDSNQ